MRQIEREFYELAARYQRLSKSDRGGDDSGLIECRDLLMRHVRDGGALGREALWFMLEAALPELWVARTMRAANPGAVSACATLDGQLDTWSPTDSDSFTPGVHQLVRNHIRGCAMCRTVAAPPP